VINAPLPPGLRPGGAAEVKAGSEHPENTISADKLQWRDLLAERGISVHPAADLFPMMPDDELESLARDIAENGLRQGVVLWISTRMPVQTAAAARGAMLLDGRNRLAAAVRALNGEPERLAETLDAALYVNPQNGARLIGGEIDPWDFVISANLRRRHLSVDDRKRIAEELLRRRPQRSDRDIGRQVRLDHKTIGSLRAENERRGEIPHVSSRTDSAGRQQPATKPAQPGKEAQLRAMREAHANAQPSPGAAPASDAGRVQNAILNAYLVLKAADDADLRAARRALNADQASLALEHIEGARVRLGKLEAALRGDG
jgi:hypothetical protein